MRAESNDLNRPSEMTPSHHDSGSQPTGPAGAAGGRRSNRIQAAHPTLSPAALPLGSCLCGGKKSFGSREFSIDFWTFCMLGIYVVFEPPIVYQITLPP